MEQLLSSWLWVTAIICWFTPDDGTSEASAAVLPTPALQPIHKQAHFSRWLLWKRPILQHAAQLWMHSHQAQKSLTIWSAWIEELLPLSRTFLYHHPIEAYAVYGEKSIVPSHSKLTVNKPSEVGGHLNYTFVIYPFEIRQHQSPNNMRKIK